MTWLNFEINTNTKSSQCESMAIVQKDFCSAVFPLFFVTSSTPPPTTPWKIRRKNFHKSIAYAVCNFFHVFFFSFSSSFSYLWLDPASDINCRPFKFENRRRRRRRNNFFTDIYTLLVQSISSGSQCIHIWHSSFENPFWCFASNSVYFIRFFCLHFCYWHSVKRFYLST